MRGIQDQIRAWGGDPGRGEDRGGGHVARVAEEEGGEPGKQRQEGGGDRGQWGFFVTFSPSLASWTLVVTPVVPAAWTVQRDVRAAVRGRPSSALACLQAILRAPWVGGHGLTVRGAR